MKNKLYALEFLRIYACILVYFWHIGRDTADSNPLFIFFVLSGFVIAWRYFPANEFLAAADRQNIPGTYCCRTDGDRRSGVESAARKTGMRLPFSG